MMNRYKVIDSQGYVLRVFPTYQQAFTYKYACGGWDWVIR